MWPESFDVYPVIMTHVASHLMSITVIGIMWPESFDVYPVIGIM